MSAQTDVYLVVHQPISPAPLSHTYVAAFAIEDGELLEAVDFGLRRRRHPSGRTRASATTGATTPPCRRCSAPCWSASSKTVPEEAR